MNTHFSKKLISLFLFGALVLEHWSFPSAIAQTSPPSDLKFICSTALSITKSSPCILQVPANIIGASFDITIPKQKVTGIQNLRKNDSLPSSGLFFQLETKDESNNFRLQIDYADLKAQTSTTPYALFQFDLVLSGVASGDFPIVISAPLKSGGQLFTSTSLSRNDASFKATADVPLEIRITGVDTVHSSPTPIPSSFTPLVGGGGSGFVPNINSRYCFNDPKDSMPDEEWAVICEAKRRGIISGNPTDDGVFFLPNQPINRAEAVKIVTLGILRTLGKLSDDDFSAREKTIRDAFGKRKFISYPDITYEKNGEPPWFAIYVNIASEEEIVSGYPQDGTYRAENRINNAEAYRVIVETGRIASEEISQALGLATLRNIRHDDWFAKYAATLEEYEVPFSEKYGEFTTRKEFLLIVMNLLSAVGL